MQREYWNKNANNKNFTTPLDVNRFQELVPKNALILDIGCGYGRTLADLYGLGYKRLIGVDTSMEMVKRGKASYPYIDIRYQESSLIEINDNSVDAVILFGVMCCTPKHEEQKSLINEIKRVLKPNGYLFLNDFLINKDLRNSLRYRQYEEKYGEYGVFESNDGLVLKHFFENELIDLFTDFEEIYRNKTKCKTMNGGISNSISFIGKLK